MSLEWEKEWHVNCVNSLGEEIKQVEYAKRMGLRFFHNGKSPFNIDCSGLSIVDIGGGPYSLLLKTNARRKVVVDPLDMPDWVLARYKAAGVEVIKQRGEDLDMSGFDEAWIYNVLTHTEDPQKIIKNALKAANTVRIFEWIDTPTNIGHPTSLSSDTLNSWLGVTGNTELLKDQERGLVGKCYYAVVSRKTPVPISKHPDHYRFHYLGLVHLPISESHYMCAFTTKIVRLTKMLMSLGHEVFLYGAEGSTARCSKLFPTHTLEDIREEWGDKPPREDFDIGYDYTSGQYRHDFNSAPSQVRIKYIENAIKLINSHKRDDDFLLLSMGMYQKPIADKVGLFLTCEPGVGYRGSYCRFRAFESAYIQNFTYGSEHPRESINGDYYSRVIPNYLEDDEFPFSPEPKDYFVYIGRLILRKGVWTAIKATQEIGAKLVIAGQPDPEIDISKFPPHCQYIGAVNPKERAELLGGAIALFLPTVYLEPFGTTHIEAMACGTPVITTSFGVFGGDTFVDGVHGYKCNTLDDFVFAAKNAHKLDRKEIRKNGERFFMSNIKWQFQRWFDDLYQLYLSTRTNCMGWHHIRQEDPVWRSAIYDNMKSWQ